MKILFLTPNFPPEVGAPQTRIYEQARRLAALGHEVSVLTTFPNYPTGIVPPEWRGHIFWKGSDEGIRIHRTWTYTVANQGFLKRVLSQLSFALSAIVAGMALPAPDLMIVESPPLFDGIAGVVLGWAYGAPYIFSVADLWPESAVQMGMLRSPFLIRLAKTMELFFYRRAAAVLAVTAGIQRAIAGDGIKDEKIVLFRNAVDCDFFRPLADAMSFRQRLGLSPEHFVVLYAGTTGLSHGLEVLLRTAQAFQHERNDRVRFVIAGAGADKENLERQATEMGLRNLCFFDPFPKAVMPQLLGAADCVAVTLRDLPIFRGAIPTKLLDALACAKPVVLAVEGEAADLLREAHAGYCVRPEDAKGIHDAIEAVMADPERAEAMGLRGRAYAMKNFSREARMYELHELLCRVANTGPRTKVSPSKTALPDETRSFDPIQRGTSGIED